MDVKSAFLDGILHEKAYVEKPKGFENPHFPNHVYKLNKALYGLKQALQAWYERLTNFLIEKGYGKGEMIKHFSSCTSTLVLLLYRYMLMILCLGLLHLQKCKNLSIK